LFTVSSVTAQTDEAQQHACGHLPSYSTVLAPTECRLSSNAYRPSWI